MANRLSRRKKKKYVIRKRFIELCLIIAVLTVLGSAFLLTRLWVTYQDSRESYREVAEAAIISSSPEPSDTPQAMLKDGIATLPMSDSLPTPPIQIDWLNARAMNKHIIAWLYCKDTNINYPITQSKNNTYYLTHNVKEKEDQAGSLFMDYRNSLGKEDENLIIYGHRMKDGSMFGYLAKFSEKDYVDDHTEFFLLTLDCNYKIVVFACRTTHPESKYFPTSFTDNNAESKYIDKSISQSYWQMAPSPRPDGAILVTLVTCSKYDFYRDPRLLVHAWAVPIVEQ